jgi:hypothetical protein
MGANQQRIIQPPNLKAALVLHFAYYNFCRKALRCTPAMEAGITKHIWELGNLLG